MISPHDDRRMMMVLALLALASAAPAAVVAVQTVSFPIVVYVLAALAVVSLVFRQFIQRDAMLTAMQPEGAEAAPFQDLGPSPAPVFADELDSRPVVSMDERFLARCREIIDERLDDDELTVEAYARAVGLSRAQLHRKLKALTGLSARGFIREHRLRRGAALLRGRHGNVTEVAYAVGFKNPSHFARCFREQFGTSPSAYAQQDQAPSGIARHAH